MCVVVVADLRRQAAADRSAAAARVVGVDACTSFQAPPRPRHDQTAKPAAAPPANRRRTRRKRDGAAAARAAVDVTAAAAAVAQSTDSSTEDVSATSPTDATRPRLRRKKKAKSKKTSKYNGAECLRVESSAVVAPVEAIVKLSNGVDDVAQRTVEDERRQNVTTESLTSSFIDVCQALPAVDDLPEVDGVSCEPEDGSSSRPEAEVIDYSECSTLGSGRSPAAQASPVPPASTTTSTSLYGQQQQTAAGLQLSDVHGSLPLLSRTEHRLLAASDRADVSRLPKSMSLQGYGHLLSVDAPAPGRHHYHRHRRHQTAANYRPLAGQHGRHTLSRLDVEYINRSQIFRMISG